MEGNVDTNKTVNIYFFKKKKRELGLGVVVQTLLGISASRIKVPRFKFQVWS